MKGNTREREIERGGEERMNEEDVYILYIYFRLSILFRIKSFCV